MPTAEWRKANREKLCKYRREWYARNKEAGKANAMRNKLRLREWYKELKTTLKCERCSESHYACMEFHHLDPKQKEFSLAKVYSRGLSKKRILEEVSKCIVLCANCHRKEHHKDK